MKNYTQKRWGKKTLQLAVVLSLAVDWSGVAFAYSDALISSKDGKAMFDVVFADQDEYATKEGSEFQKSAYTLQSKEKEAIGTGLQYWADILGTQSRNMKPVQVLVGTTKEANAFATTHTNNFASSAIEYAEALQNGKKLEQLNLRDLKNVEQTQNQWAFSNIIIGKYLGAERKDYAYGWYIDADTALPENEQAADLIGTVRHEMGHALGIAADTDSQTIDNEKMHFFGQDINKTNAWSAHLMDRNGNHAKSNMQIVTSQKFDEMQTKDPSIRATDYFIIDEGENAYFVGDHVSEVLQGATFDGRNALPVNGWEKGRPEFSHLQTTGMMSHRSYSNYTNFMEVELAVMQDLGYGIDRKNYFGYSVYDSGKTIVNRNGYFARNADGTAYLSGVYNTTALGVGLHIYGGNNKITQAADIFTAGNGGVGIRIDGTENNLTLDRDHVVHADGYRGIGILAAYGRGHEITQNGTVTADGEGGVGIRFDFGSSSNGAVDEYRGSYIRYIREVNETGEIGAAGNLGFQEYSSIYPATPELDGALVENYNLNGALSGKKNAIFIGKNAFVNNININNGAAIRGDISSEWKHFQTEEGIYDAVGDAREMLKLRYDGVLYDYDDYVPELVTKLNFNADMYYDGKISGSDNIKLYAGSHELRYGGAADVIGVEVARDAALLGGTYTVNRQQIKGTATPVDMSVTAYAAMPKDAADTGNFVSKGTIGALNRNGEITNMKITSAANGPGDRGKFSADGNIRFTAQKEQVGQIEINNFAETALGKSEGLRLTFDRNGLYIPDYTYKMDQMIMVDGTSTSIAFNGFDAYQTGMLNAEYKDVGVSFTTADHLGDKNEKQQTMFDVLQKVRGNHSEWNAEYAALYNLDAAQAKESLTSIYGGTQASLATAIQKDRYLADTVYRRLNDPHSGNGDFWFDMQKGWDAWGDDKVKDQTLYGAVGLDRKAGDAWVWGGLLAYGKHDLSGRGESASSHDLRLAAYGGYRVGAFDLATYLAYGRQNNHSERRLSNLDLGADARYRSEILSLGAKAGYDLQYSQNKIWHTSPYAEIVLNRYRQDAFTETGAGVYNQHGRGFNASFVTAGCGVEVKRDFQKRGSYAFHVGYRRVLTGDDNAVATSFAIDDSQVFGVMGSKTDKNIFTAGVQGSVKVRDNLSINGELTKDWGKTVQHLRMSVQAKWEY